ncbi:MAG: alpha/beta fold hydrolase [Merdibacter sp.]
MKQNRLFSFFQTKERPIILTVHGYGRRRSHEMDNLAAWAKKERFDIIQFDLYDLFDETDCDPKIWLSRAEEKIKECCQKQQPLYLVGFSMGGVIASYLASLYPVDKLVLVAPAFTYLDLSKTAGYLRKGTKHLFHSDGSEEEITVPKSFYPAFVDIIKNCRDSIASVHCPILILHGDEDETIPLKSSLQAYEKIRHAQKRLIILHEGHHHLLSEPWTANECYQLILLFFKGEIVTKKRNFAPDILGTLRMQKKEQER